MSIREAASPVQIKLHDFDEGALNGLEERSPADAMRILEVFRTSNPQEKDNKCETTTVPTWARVQSAQYAEVQCGIHAQNPCSVGCTHTEQLLIWVFLHAAAYLCSLLKHKKRPDGRVCPAADRILQVADTGSAVIHWNLTMLTRHANCACCRLCMHAQ